MSAALVETTRRLVGGGELVESVHHGHLVVTDQHGHPLAAVGEPDRLTFVRSAAKPLQAAACLELLKATVPAELLAVGWSSHRGEPEHLDAVTRLLETAGLGPEDLTTPEAAPDGSPRPLTRLGHNCSGKHALFALTGAILGLGGADLLDPERPLQAQVLGDLRRELGRGRELPVAVDGCGAPAVAAPLAQLAGAYARLAGAPDGPAAEVVAAGHAHPSLVGGTDRLETALLAAGVVAKPGAEGVFAAGWVVHGEPVGVAVKIDDGAHRAASAALHALVVAAGAVEGPVWAPPPVLGGGAPVGAVRATAVVTSAGRGLRRP